MNEVRFTQTANIYQVGTASSPGAVEARSPSGGKELPTNTDVTEAKAQPQAEPVAKEALESAVVSISEFVQSVQRDLQFSVDEELDQTVIKVVDGGSGELIRQIPEDVFLELARKLNNDGEISLLNALG